MRFGRYAIPYFILRVTLGLTFLWIGLDMFRHPDIWIGYLPASIPLSLTRETALQLAAVFDVALGALLITGHFRKIVAWLATLHLLGIIITQGIDSVVIRDVGLLGSALTLALWPYHRKKHWLKKLPLIGGKKKSVSSDDED